MYLWVLYSESNKDNKRNDNDKVHIKESVELFYDIQKKMID